MTTYAKPSNEDILNTAVDLVDSGLTILGDTSSVLAKAPLVGPIFDVIKKILQFRNEIKQNENRCQEIITKVDNFRNDLLRYISDIVDSGVQDNLTKLEEYLRECKDTLSSILTMLEQYGSRSRFAKFVNRGLDDLIAVENRINDLNDRLSRNILVDIKITQAVSAPSAGESPGFNGLAYILPGKPELMIERQTQVDAALAILLKPAPTRIAIIGGGGFGKTTLAKMILHDPKITKRYQSRYFLDCVGRPTANTLLQGFGSMLGLKEATSTILASAHRRLETSTTLLCLDNFETPWEPSDTRGKVEDILETIAAIPNLSLIITLRGEQRPGKPMWSTPLLPPLSTLSLEGSQSMLQCIASDHKINDYTLKLLETIDGIPLAIRLVSTLLRDGESSESLWRRWCKNYTEVIQTGGNDRESNLNRSISLSVSSPRMNEDPVASRQLLAVLSLLPEGFPTDENSLKNLQKHLNSESASVVQKLRAKVVGKAPIKQSMIKDIDHVVQTLRQVSLIRVDEAETSSRFKMLSPIRLYCQQSFSTETTIVLAKVVNYYIDLLFEAGENIVTKYKYYAQVVPEIKNIHSVLQKAFAPEISKDLDIPRLIDATILLSEWSSYTGYYARDTVQMALSMPTHMPDQYSRCLMSLGDLYERDNDNEQAEKSFRDAVKWSSKLGSNSKMTALGQRYLGNLLFNTGKIDEAELVLKASLEGYTRVGSIIGVADIRYCLATLSLSKGLDSEAEAIFTSILDVFKQSRMVITQANITLQLASILVKRASLVEAKKFATESLATATQCKYEIGQGRALLCLGQIDILEHRLADAKPAFAKAVEIFKHMRNPALQASACGDLGLAYIQSDQLSAAEALLTDYLDSKFPIIFTTLGWLYICGGRLDKAEQHLDNALQLAQKASDKFQQASALMYLGRIYLKSGRLDDAKRVIESIPDVCPGLREVELYRLCTLGEVYITKGQLDDAEASFNVAIAHVKKDLSLYLQGNISRSLGTLNVKRGRVDVAIEKFLEALEFHRKAQWVSEQATDLEHLGEAYKLLGKAEEAEAKFEEARALMDTVAEARVLS